VGAGWFDNESSCGYGQNIMGISQQSDACYTGLVGWATNNSVATAKIADRRLAAEIILRTNGFANW